MNTPVFTVGITGPSGSGKTSFLHSLLEQFREEEVCLISQDNYYKPHEVQQRDKNGLINFDTPNAINMEAYAQDIRALQQGQEVKFQEYDFTKFGAKPKWITLNPAPIIIVEGLFIYHDEELKELFDLKVFIDVEDHIRLKRRILRDNAERGQKLDEVLYRYEYHVFPAYQKYIAPHRYESDVIVPNNHNFDNGMSVLVAFLRSKLNTTL